MQELVYKGGQAGVTKATVTITFDNSAKQQSPLGYEAFDEITVSRQVVIGGRNKYLINGSNAIPSRVQDLFRSVSLNVNNPHFLIMQGRITKVLNMKPPEILSMVEEAAGTRLYESKKSSAQRTIEKKDSKLREIEKILEEEITPTLRRLKEERSSYLEYQKVTRELEHLSRLSIAYQFVQAEELRKNSAADVEEAKNLNEELKIKHLEISQDILKATETLNYLLEKRSQESQGPIKELEKEVDQCAKALAVTDATLKNSKDQFKSENKNHQDLIKSLDEDEALLSKKKDDISNQQEMYQQLQDRVKETEEALMSAQQHFQAVSSGLSSGVDGQADTLAAQKIARENEISTAQTQIKQAEMRLKSIEAEVKDMEKSSKINERSYIKDKSIYDAVQKEIANVQSSMDKLQYREGNIEELKEKREVLTRELSNIKMKIEQLESRFPQLLFEYTDPSPRFDRTCVKGPVAKLVRVNDVSTATALEVTAGGRLYNIVVDTEETGKQLLQKGKLKRRYTIIPLNKISARRIPDSAVKKAQQLVGPDKVKPAISLIGYEDELKSAMQYVFGSTFICDTLQDAKQVTFDKRVMTRSVTLSGDVFDPSGTLTGGARPQTSAILLKLQELFECECESKQKLQQLHDLNKEIDLIQKKASQYAQLKEQFESKQHDSELVWARLEQSSHHQQIVQVEQLKEAIKTQKDVLNQSKEMEKKAKKQLKDIQSKLEDSKGHRDRELRAANEGLDIAKKKAEDAVNNARTHGQEMETLKLEVTELESSITSQRQQIENVVRNINELQSTVETHTTIQDEAKQKLMKAENELQQYRAVLKEKNKELQQQERLCRDLESAQSNHLLKKKEMEHTIAKHQKDCREASARVESMLSKYDWIPSEQQYFGQPNTAYDFGANEPREVQTKLTKLQERKEKLSKNVNMRAMNMLGKAEEKFTDLTKKKKIVENDKAKISELITELDQKKNETLQTAWKKVNQDFGSIFSTLLPGASANLSPPEGMSELEGLEIKVAFGGVWKESLTELSGGQRSLVALSLILSLLLFKPAPLYILDEVDAALDLSHTQNIGQMLRTHFNRSQFIVVSLKNGMFNNANVLFKTKFVDGVSTVTRYANPRIGSTPGNKENETVHSKTSRTRTTARSSSKT